MKAKEFSFLVQAGVRQLTKLNEQCEKEFKISTLPRWRCNLDRGTLTFLQGEAPRVRASIQVIGTATKPKTWLWAWANENLPKDVTEAAVMVREFGRRENLEQLVTESIASDDYLGWEMTALAARLSGAKGAYRCKSEQGLLYLTYTSIGFVPELAEETREPEGGTNGKSRRV